MGKNKDIDQIIAPALEHMGHDDWLVTRRRSILQVHFIKQCTVSKVQAYYPSILNVVSILIISVQCATSTLLGAKMAHFLVCKLHV